MKSPSASGKIPAENAKSSAMRKSAAAVSTNAMSRVAAAT
jgi:hypothetical protein